MLKHLLFETRLGEALLALVENHLGIAIVDANWLGRHRPAITTAPGGAAAK